MSLFVPHPGSTPDPKRDHLTASELQVFKKQRDAGQITVFRTVTCKRDGCEVEIPRGKLFCCLACKEKSPPEPAPTATPELPTPPPPFKG